MPVKNIKKADRDLVAVDEEPRVHRRPLPPPNVERANALSKDVSKCEMCWREGKLNKYKLVLDPASKEVITLRSSLAVSAESRVESRSYCVSQEGSQVKL